MNISPIPIASSLQISNSSSFTVNRYFFLLSLLASFSPPILFTFLYESSGDIIICSTVHAALSALVLYRVASESLIRKTNISMATIFILINLLYFSISSIKYFESELYPGFISNNWIRLLFSLLALTVLWVAFEIVNRYRQDHLESSFSIDNANLLRILIITLLVLIVYSLWDTYQKGLFFAYISLSELRDISMEQSALPLMEKLKVWLMGSLMGFMPMLLALSYRQRGSRLLVISAFLVTLLYSVVNGTRGSLFFFVFGLLIAYIRLYAIGKRYFVYLVILFPLILSMFTFTLLPFTKGMVSFDKETIKWQLAYRFDLSDFAVTLLQGHEFSFNYDIVTDAFVYSIPKAILEDKYDTITNSYEAQLEERGLTPTIDYTDTFFSIGAQLAGLIGYVFCPFFFIIFLFYFERVIYSLFGGAANIIIINCLPLYIRVENDLNGLFTDWRMLPMYIFLGLIEYWLFIKVVHPKILKT